MKKLLLITIALAFISLELFSQATAPVWTDASTGTIDGVAFTVTGGNGSGNLNLSGADYSAGPLSSNEQYISHNDDANLTITFASPVTDVAIYLTYWRGGNTITFNHAGTKLSGNANFSVTGNAITTTGTLSTYSNGIVVFPGAITTLSFTTTGLYGGSLIGSTFAIVPQVPPAAPKNVSISDDPAFTADDSAILDINSTDNDKGVLLPRMTAAERNAISSPATGLIVFITDTNTLSFYNGTDWMDVDATISPL